MSNNQGGTIPNIQPYKVEPVNTPPTDSGVNPPVSNTGSVGTGSQINNPLINPNIPSNQPLQAGQPILDQPVGGDQPPGGINNTSDPLTPAPYATGGRRNRRGLIWLAGGALLLGGLLLVGGLTLFGGGSSPQTDEQLGTGANITLQWWGGFLDPAVVQPLLDEYTQDVNPNVTVQYSDKIGEQISNSAIEKAAVYKRDINTLLSDTDAGVVLELPDIFVLDNNSLGDYVGFTDPTNNKLFANPSATAEGFGGEFYPAVVEDFTNNSQVYGIPLWMDNLAVVYNKDIVETEGSTTTLPSDWSSFISLAEQLTAYDGNQMIRGGFGVGNGNNISFYFELFNLLLEQNGVDIADADGSPIFANDSDSQVAFNFYKEFQTGRTPTWSQDFKNDSIEFLEQDAAMIVTTSWRLRDLLRIRDSIDQIDFEIGVAPLPTLSGQTSDNLNWATYWGNVVTANRPEVNRIAAWEFLEWMSEPEQLRKLHTNIAADTDNYGYFGQLYPRIDMATELEEDAWLTVFNSTLQNTRSWYASRGDQIRAIYQNMLNSSSSSAIDTAQDEIIDEQVLRGSLITTN